MTLFCNSSMQLLQISRANLHSVQKYNKKRDMRNLHTADTMKDFTNIYEIKLYQFTGLLVCYFIIVSIHAVLCLQHGNACSRNDCCIFFITLKQLVSSTLTTYVKFLKVTALKTCSYAAANDRISHVCQLSQKQGVFQELSSQKNSDCQSSNGRI